MYTLYKIAKRKTRAKGFWLDNSGKVYADNIILIKYKTRAKLTEGIRRLFAEGEKAVFYTEGVRRGVCIGQNGQKTVYNNRLIVKRLRLSIKEVKRFLEDFGGLTIFKSLGLYWLEVYSA